MAKQPNPPDQAKELADDVARQIGATTTSRWAKTVFILGKPVFYLIVVLGLIHFFVATVFIVDGVSMDPTLKNGEVVVVNRLAYLISPPAQGDIVVLRYPGDPQKRKFVKRIIGRPGDIVTIASDRFLVNGRLLTEAYLDPMVATEVTNPRFANVKLGQQEYYAAGDNRPLSNDSRFFGLVPGEFLIGRVKWIIWPPKDWRFVAPTFYE